MKMNGAGHSNFQTETIRVPPPQTHSIATLLPLSCGKIVAKAILRWHHLGQWKRSVALGLIVRGIATLHCGNMQKSRRRIARIGWCRINLTTIHGKFAQIGCSFVN
jgi:hypothetical protein